MSGFLASIAGATYAAAVVNTAVAFDGTNDFYSVSGLTTTATDSKYLTIAFTWFHASGANSRNQNFMNVRLGTTNGENGWEVCLQSGRFRYSAPDNSGSDTDMVYGDGLYTTENAYNQMVAYIDHTSFANCKWYVNGVDRTSSLLNGAAIGAVNLANNNFNWGSSNVSIKIGEQDTAYNGSTGFDDFVGRISQIYAHNASGAPTISKFWNSTSGLPIDLGTNGTATGLAQPLIYHYGSTATFPTNNGTGFNSYTLTATGNVASAEGPTYGAFVRSAVSLSANSTGAVISTAQSKFGGASMFFDGTNDLVTSGVSSSLALNTGNWTVEGWIYTSDDLCELINYQDYNTNNGWAFGLRSSGRFLFVNTDGGSSLTAMISSNNAYANNTWTHFAVVYNSGTLTLYANGTNVGSQSWVSPDFASVDGLRIGGGYGISSGLYIDGVYYYSGYLDEVRISNTARYTAGFSVATSAFTNDANTVLLLHGDGTNGSTTFTDSTT
jgi:hypothetical protein